ncbi:hypothetical protein Hypma_009746 [Hypsizygus marmoreus]|uniref:Uncharacterized protein n=1 Tax=Hypsizygus marmoreus TaxID=39966 RepID=A0A369JR40_HYPMA|nr:hypothetical protein Hypma_009746 [Hypsizygus marmoreus]
MEADEVNRLVQLFADTQDINFVATSSPHPLSKSEHGSWKALVWVLYDRDQRLLFAFVPLLIGFSLITTLFLNKRSSNTSGMKVRSKFLMDVIQGNTTVRRFRVVILRSSMMFAMTLYKCIPTLRLGMPSRMPIINLFLRDGVFWFLGVLISASAAMISWLVGRPSIVYLVNTIFSLVASHALLNIKAILIAVTNNDDLDGDYDSSNFHPTTLRRLSNASASPRRGRVDGFWHCVS